MLAKKFMAAACALLLSGSLCMIAVPLARATYETNAFDFPSIVATIGFLFLIADVVFLIISLIKDNKGNN